MKKLLLTTIVIAAVLIGNGLNAQTDFDRLDKRNEVNLQISDGMPITFFNSFFFALGDIFASPFSNYSSARETKNAFGHLGLSYKHTFNNWFAMGIMGSYQLDKMHYVFTHKNDPSIVKSGDRKLHSVLIMPTFEFTYVSKPILQLYGGFDAGLSLFKNESVSYDENGNISDEREQWTPFFAAQLTPIGIRVGKQVAGFAEVGFGFRGVFTAGLSIRL